MPECVQPMFPCKNFIVSDLTLRDQKCSLTYIYSLGLTFTNSNIFMYGISKCSSFILSQVVDPVFPAQCVKEIIFSPLYSFASFLKDKVSRDAWIYLWTFYFVPLIYFSVFVPLPYCLEYSSFVEYFEVRQVDWFLQFHPSFSRLLWESRKIKAFCVSIQIVKVFVLVLWKILLVAWYGLHWIFRLLCVVYSLSLYLFFQSMNMVYLSTYLCRLWFLSSVLSSFLCMGLLFL